MTRLPTRRQSLAKRLNALLDKLTPQIRDAFLTAVGDVKDSATLRALTEAIEAGDPIRAFRILGFSDAAMRPITAAIERAYEIGGITTAESFPRVLDPLTGTRTLFRFDVRNSRAEAWVRDRSSTLVTRIADEQLQAIRVTLFQGVRDGRNPRNVALDIVGRIDPTTGRRTGGIVGLTRQQSRFVLNARAELADPLTAENWFTRKRRDRRFDSIVRKSIRDGTSLSGETINKLTGRYSDSLLQLRGENIGRTEALQSLNTSSHEAFRQVVENGGVKASAVKRVWDSAGHDGRTRDSHLAMEGQTVGMDEPFTTPGGFKLMFPGDSSLGAPAEEIINCRCVVRINVDWLAEAD